MLFNIPNWLISHLTEKFNISEWRFEENPNPPRHYVKLFRYIDWHLFENIGNYRWFVNDLYLYSFRGLFEKLRIVTDEMNPWFEKNGYPRNTRDQSEIDQFLDRLRQNNLKE